MSNTVISYPIPPYSNVPINAQYYLPSRFVITAITLGNPTVITTSINHNYVIGQLTRLIIPPSFGSRQLNEQQGYVIAIPAPNQVTLLINSSVNVDPFILSTATTVAQILAIGDVNTGSINNQGRSSTGTFVPGAFVNVSPI